MFSTAFTFIPLGASLAMAQFSPLQMPPTDFNQQLESRQATQYFNDGDYQGCFSSPGGQMQDQGSDTYQSSGNCGPICSGQGKPVMATQGFDCYCGELLPALSSRVSDSTCDSSCPGIGSEMCGGGTTYWSVYITEVATNGQMPSRVQDNVNGGGHESKSTSSSHVSHHTPHPTPHKHPHPHPQQHHTHHNKPVTTKVLHSTVFTNVPGSPTQNSDSSLPSSSSSSDTGKTIGIAVGVIGGVVVFGAAVAGILFYLRRRRRMKNAENGHRRADSLNAYVASGAPLPGAPQRGPLAGRVPQPSITPNDSRLDPWVMRETRRESGASFLADNQDYSRRILKVTNPDA